MNSAMNACAPARAARPAQSGLYTSTLGRRLALALVSLVATGTALAETFLHQDFQSTATTNTPAWVPNVYGGTANTNGGISTSTGTIDTFGTVTRGKSFRVNFTPASGYWLAGGGSGKLANPNYNGFGNSTAELNLLNLSFDYRSSQPNPVRVRVSSYDTNSWNAPKTNYLEFLVTPPVKDAYKRFSFDLGAPPFNSSGSFNPRAAFLEITLEAHNSGDGTVGWPQGTHFMEMDNVSLSRPSFYVDSSSTATPLGTATNPYTTIQAAINAATAGDVIVVRSGSGYNNPAWDSASQSAFVANARFKNKSGSPSQWIVMRNYPGESPVIRPRSDSYAAIAINQKGCGYIEVRGMTVTGWGAEITSPGLTIGTVTHTSATAIANSTKNNLGELPPVVALYNGSGISVVDAGDGPMTHHIRVIGNTVRYNTSVGIGGGSIDYYTMEDNIVSNNCYYTRYATSGMGILSAKDFTSEPEFRIYYLGNRSYNNQCFAYYNATNNEISDGHGIICDRFLDSSYTGKTLIQNNVTYGNGGAGIQAFLSSRVTIINNTASQNAKGPTQRNQSQIDLNSSKNCVVINNILNPWIYDVPAAERTASTRPFNVGLYNAGTVAAGNTISYNLSYRNGDATAHPAPARYLNGVVTTPNTNIYGNPFFSNSDLDLQSASAAIDAGDLSAIGAPRVDFDGMPRPQGNLTKIDIGAHEF
ncbi:MAG: right-handed parallel beta-helix repeat-containing protein [Burkholderiales bacterium]|nr:right-handed parallel beta-helix repeat-containing protein [Opitutaceae bacterium]